MIISILIIITIIIIIVIIIIIILTADTCVSVYAQYAALGMHNTDQ